ncbi:MAG: Gx transporter family protein [Clostridia bacterium]|nr:Gx transporter family protein [Clostridia bacterium]
MNKTRKLTTMAITVSLAIVLSWVDRIITSLAPLPPGIKLGLANVAVVFALYKLGVKEGAIISIIRVILTSILFGSAVSFWYAIAGATVSLVLMILLKECTPLSCVTVSTVGGISHNIAQICVASILFDTNLLIYYLPFLLVAGVVAGIVIGTASALLVNRIKIK